MSCKSTWREQSVYHPTFSSCTVHGCQGKSAWSEHNLCLIQHFLRAPYKDVQVSQREHHLCFTHHVLYALCLEVWVSQHQVSTICVPSNTSYTHCTRMSGKSMRSEWSVSHPTIPTCTVQGCLSESTRSEHSLSTYEHCTRMCSKSVHTCGISALQKRCQVFALAQPTPAAVSPIAGSVAATLSSLQSFSSPF